VPVLVVIEVPGGSSALDEVLFEQWHLDRTPPHGNSFRLAGPMDGGWRVISLWESTAQFEEFLNERLHITLRDSGSEAPTVTVWEVETVHRFD
jgi:hypothetical protein